jgi:hypothetical protein
MYNNDISLRADLPSSGRLLRSTLIAAISAALLLTLVVLPAEYGIDPTGVGRVLQLTEMGDIKTRLEAEAAADSNADVTTASLPAAPVPLAVVPAANVSAATPGANTALPAVAAVAEAIRWRDEFSFTLVPGEGTEVKMRMKANEKAFYFWTIDGGVVNYDTHGDEGGRSLSYVKGRGIATDQGELVAAFTGNHGWYWRNRGAADVKLVLRTRGAYSDIQRMK